MAARNLLHGGVHYRDLFDTNLPGFVWVMTALYAGFGPNVIVVRLVDLLIVLGVVLLIDRLAKWGGATPAGRWWVFASTALFYPFTAEMSHAQRDTWMALPSLVAVLLRVRRGVRCPDSPTLASHFRHSFYEGLLWGAAVWMKPHIALMAMGVWLLTVWRLAAEFPRPRQAIARDFLGNLLGGLAVGLPGVCWLVASGAWPAFHDVFTNWNPYYMRLAQNEFDIRLKDELFWFPPWSLGLILTLPLAVLSVLDMAPWLNRAGTGSGAGWLGRRLPWQLWDKQAGPDARFVRGVLGGLYLVWAAQAFFVQRGFQYVHVPETLLMFGLWASHRWAWAFVAIVWLALTSGLWLVADSDTRLKNELNGVDAKIRERFLPRHLLTDTDRLRLWPECWRLCMPDSERYALWDKLNRHPPHEAVISWTEIAELAEFFRAQGVKDGEVLAWFDSPHAVFLLLDVKPGFRYMHVFTAISINTVDAANVGYPQVMTELEAADRAKYAISDLEWVVVVSGTEEHRREDFLGPPRNPPRDLLPAHSPLSHMFPFNQPTIFRTRNGHGRYIVHKIETRSDSP
jgi:hypothetical protein